jgi:hypothetical protein
MFVVIKNTYFYLFAISFPFTRACSYELEFKCEFSVMSMLVQEEKVHFYKFGVLSVTGIHSPISVKEI